MAKSLIIVESPAKARTISKYLGRGYQVLASVGGLMKPGAGLINMSRAAVVDYEALADKLRDGSLAGAILDVFNPEPLPPDSALWTTPNLVITPHVSSDDDVAYIPLTLDLFFDNMARYLDGRPLRNRVRPALGY